MADLKVVLQRAVAGHHKGAELFGGVGRGRLEHRRRLHSARILVHHVARAPPHEFAALAVHRRRRRRTQRLAVRLDALFAQFAQRLALRLHSLAILQYHATITSQFLCVF